MTLTERKALYEARLASVREQREKALSTAQQCALAEAELNGAIVVVTELLQLEAEASTATEDDAEPPPHARAEQDRVH
jgi:hypothetical protein